MNKKQPSLLFLIESFISIKEENSIEKSTNSQQIISLKSNCIPNFFKYQSETFINGHNKLKKYSRNKKYNNSIADFQKITNNSDNLLNEINLNLNHQNKVSQPI